MLLQLEAVGLVGLTVLLAGPVSALLARARWTTRSPRAALVLWQAVGLGGGLGILTAGLTMAAGSLNRQWLPGLLAVPTHWSKLGACGWSGAVLTGLVGAWLVGMTAASTARVLRARHAHRRRLEAIADRRRVAPGGTGAAGVRVRLLDHPRAVAYCLPGLRPQVVLSSGALATLSAGELAAVLAHEQAHARGHHDLVTQPFVAWARTFPFLPTARRAVTAVDLLVEMLADNRALRRCRPGDLQTALRRLADSAAGPLDGELTGRLAARTDRLSGAAAGLPWAFSVLVYAAATAVVLGPPLILLCS